jgi:hypothetical protein
MSGAPQMRSPARAGTRNRAEGSSFAVRTDTTNPAISANDLAAAFLDRGFLPLPIAARVARLAQLGGAIS